MTRHHNGDARVFPGPTLPYKLLQVALVVSGVACIGLYPLALAGRRDGHGITERRTTPSTS